jgi:hypothetical protein
MLVDRQIISQHEELKMQNPQMSLIQIRQQGATIGPLRNTKRHSITIRRKGRGVWVEGCLRVWELWPDGRLKLLCLRTSRCDILQLHLHVPTFSKSGKLNLPETSTPAILLSLSRLWQFVAQQSNSELGRLTVAVFISPTIRQKHPVELLWTNDQHVAELLPREEHSCLQRESNHRPQQSSGFGPTP